MGSKRSIIVWRNFGPKALGGERSKTPLRRRGFWTFPEPMGVAEPSQGPESGPNYGPKPRAAVGAEKAARRGRLTGRCQGMGGTGNARREGDA